MSNTTTAVQTETYIEITRKPSKVKVKKRAPLTWLDVPKAFGTTGYKAPLTVSEMDLLRLLYGNRIHFAPIAVGKYHVTLRGQAA